MRCSLPRLRHERDRRPRPRRISADGLKPVHRRIANPWRAEAARPLPRLALGLASSSSWRRISTTRATPSAPARPSPHQIEPPDLYRRHPQRQRLQHIRPPANPSIRQDRYSPRHPLHHQRQRFDGRRHGIRGSRAVVRDDDTRYPRAHRRGRAQRAPRPDSGYPSGAPAAVPGQGGVQVVLALEVRQLALGAPPWRGRRGCAPQ